MIYIFTDMVSVFFYVHAFVQRDKEELREAMALLTAQQTSLEIIVNMCCSDGECCGHGKQCWPYAPCNIISCDINTSIDI